MNTVLDVIAFLERQERETFDAGVFHQDEYGTQSVTAKEAAEFGHAAEIVRDALAKHLGEDEA